MHGDRPLRNLVVQGPQNQQAFRGVEKKFLFSDLSLSALSDCVFTMSTFRSLILLVLLSTSAMAGLNSLNTSALSEPAVTASSVAATTPLPAATLTEGKRPFALALGIALVLVTFHRAFARRH